MTDIETLRWTAQEFLPKLQSDWLTKGMEILRLDFAQIGETFPEDINIEVAYPSYEVTLAWLGTYETTFSQDFHVISINPRVYGLLALDILVHELVHATVQEPGHGERFKEVAAAIGLDDKGSASSAEEVLLKRLREIRNTLGPYPPATDCLEKA